MKRKRVQATEKEIMEHYKEMEKKRAKITEDMHKLIRPPPRVGFKLTDNEVIKGIKSMSFELQAMCETLIEHKKIYGEEDEIKYTDIEPKFAANCLRCTNDKYVSSPRAVLVALKGCQFVRIDAKTMNVTSLNFDEKQWKMAEPAIFNLRTLIH